MIDFTVAGAEAVEGRLRQIPEKIQAALEKSMTRGMIELSRYVKEEKLSGQVLKNRTGTLRRKINYRVTAGPSEVVGSVGTKLAYAAAHEYGFDGTVQVRAHERQMNVAFGRAVAVPHKIMVGAFSRHSHVPERSFLRSSLRELSPKITAMLDAAVHEAL